MYIKAHSLLSSASLDPTKQPTARSENQKWSFKREQQTESFDKSNA